MVIMETDTAYYERLTQQELDLAHLETDPTAKIAHLDLAAQYATLADRRAHKSFE